MPILILGVTILAIHGGKRHRNRAVNKCGLNFFDLFFFYFFLPILNPLCDLSQKSNANPFCGLLVNVGKVDIDNNPFSKERTAV